MTAGGRRPSAFVPVPCRSVTRTTVGAAVGEWRDQGRHRLGRDEREVDRQHEDRLRAARDDVRASLGEPGVEAAGPLAEGPGAHRGRAAEDFAIGADHQHVVEAIDGQGGHNGPCQEAIDEILPLLRVERPAEPRLGALERADRDDRRDPGHDRLAKSRTVSASRARPA